MTSGRLPVTSPGSHPGDFRLLDWGHLGLVAVIFGSAFMWIALGLRSLEPGVIAFGRVAFGACALAVIPGSRRRIGRGDRLRLVTAGLAGIGAPAILFALAEQRIDSAVTGMLVSAIPLMTTVAASLMTKTMPGPRRRIGLLIGTAGVVVVALPNLTGAAAGAAGVGLVVAAIMGYATANNLLVPLSHRYGPLPVTMWALTISSVALLPLGLAGLPASSFEWVPVLSVVVLGVLGTGIARAMMVALLATVGAPRGSITAYIVPITALILGVAVLDETVEPLQVVGMLIALSGAYLVSRAD